MFNYTLLVYKTDPSIESGFRLVETKPYKNVSGNYMMDEMYVLKHSKYPLKDGWMLTFTETENLENYIDIRIDSDRALAIADECFDIMPNSNDLKMFARMIIKECIGLVESCGEQTEQDWDRAIRTASKKIKQRFGVES